MIVDDSTNAVLQQWHVEVDEITKGTTRKFQISEQLSKMDVVKLINYFEFEDNFIFNDDIDSICFINFEAFVIDRLLFLPNSLDPLKI